MNALCFSISAVCVLSLYLIAAIAEKRPTVAMKFKGIAEPAICRIISDLLCFLIILVPYVFGENIPDGYQEFVILASIILSNWAASLIYKLLEQNPNEKGYKYDIHGFILSLAIIFLYNKVFDVASTMLAFLLGFYVEFSISETKKKFREFYTDALPRVIKSCILILFFAIVLARLDGFVTEHWIAFMLPWAIGVVSGVIYIFIIRKRKKTASTYICKRRIRSKGEETLDVASELFSQEYRQKTLDQISSFIYDSTSFEGLLLVGSGAIGFADIRSDIDLIAGCYDADCVKTAAHQLQQFFTELGACHIEKQTWTSSTLGLSVYFKDGLRADISFMPTPELPICFPQYKVVFAKTERFTDTVSAGAQWFTESSRRYRLDDSIHYRFINELRYMEIALLRKQFILADIALNNARQLLLAVKTVAEGKELHQFKAYNTLPQAFLHRLEKTYPQGHTYENMYTAKENLLSLYRKTVKGCDFLTFDDNLLKLLGCYERGAYRKIVNIGHREH